jgi:hypothetical protein
MNFYLEKSKANEYLISQHKFEDNLYDRVEKMKKLFPGEKGEDKIMDYYFQQLEVISKRSEDFTKAMNDDMINVLGIIDGGMKEMTGLATKYFKPADAGQVALSQTVIDGIEQK